MSFQTISAILRGKWLLDRGYAQSYMPAVVRFLNGEPIDSFGFRRTSNANTPEGELPVLKVSTAKLSAFSVNYYTKVSNLPHQSIAVVSIVGPLLKHGDSCSFGMVDDAALINRLISAENIGGIILNIDSPGGQADGTAMLADTIMAGRQRKPIIGIIDDGMAASAAAWIGSATQEIYVTQNTDQYGSVGVYTTIADWNAHYADYYKLPVKEIYAPQSTEKNLDYKEALTGNDELIKEDLRVLADQFIKTIKRNRAGKLTSDEWTTGKMFYAKEAKRIGLIDGVKSFEQVVQRVGQLMN